MDLTFQKDIKRMKLTNSLNKYKQIVIILSIILAITILIIANFIFITYYYKNKVRQETQKEVSIYQTNTKNILLWNGTQIIEINLNEERNER